MGSRWIGDTVTKQILQMHENGMSNRQIADILGVSASTVCRRINGDNRSTNSGKSNIKDGPVTIYKPDYRRSITPNVVSTEYTYGGIAFRINSTEQSLEISTENIKIDELYCISDIEDLKQLGEALVGIAMYFEDTIKKF